MKKIALLLSLAFVFTITSCSKDDDSETTNGTSTRDKVAFSWSGDEQVRTVTALGPPPLVITSQSTDISYSTYTFSTFGTFTVDSLGTTVANGIWSILPGDKIFLIDNIGNLTDTADIILINDNNFQFETSIVENVSPIGDVETTVKFKLTK